MSTCPICGNEKDKRSKTCRDCFIKQFEPGDKKKCLRCKQILPIEEFRIRTRATPKPRSICRSCESKESSERAKRNREAINEKKREWYANNPNKIREMTIRAKCNKLGFDPEPIIEKLKTQTTCEICGSTEHKLNIDHCHLTGKFRGLLCVNCNTALSKSFGDLETLKAAVRYLERLE